MLKINKIILSLILVSAILGGCGGKSPAGPTPTITLEPTLTLPPPAIRTTPVPDAENTAVTYLEAWRSADYATMYSMLSAESQSAIDLETFTKWHQDFSYQFALDTLDYQIGNNTITPSSAEIAADLTFKSSLVNELDSSPVLNFIKDGEKWRLNWTPGIVLPQLAEGSSLRMDLEVPERGKIFDAQGKLLAGTSEAAAVGLYPDNLDPERAGSVLSLLARITNQRVDQIESRYINYPPGTVGYLPLGEVSLEENKNLINILSGASGVVIEPYTGRFYPGSGIASHAVGYISALQQGEEVEAFRRNGYRVDASIGREGLEQWGEELLAGKNGAKLYLVDAQGKPQQLLGETPLQPSQVITTTLERDFQAGVQQAMAGFRGAAVVMERDTGRILAIISSPTFDPNAYQTSNYNWSSLIGDIEGNPELPKYNRATQGQYPLGSVFKLITASAGLESGKFTPQSTYDCQYVFEELAGTPLYDWTWDHFQKDGVTKPSGMLTLPEGLIRSCNLWFYKIGLDLFNAGQGSLISKMARGFGLGQKTGIEGLPEEAGNIPEPPSGLDATNISIGQGEVLVTPLQVARFIAAIGNGGTLYRPQIIQAIGPEGGPATKVFEPEVIGKLPISNSTLKVLQDAMRGVVDSKKPLGTAFNVFNGFGIPVHGKTGTATSPEGDPHAWFAGYTAAENPDRPDIAVAVIAENQGEGSQWAAPIFRRIIELYFNGRPGKLYRWETGYGITKTPTPYGFELTPTPEGP